MNGQFRELNGQGLGFFGVPVEGKGGGAGIAVAPFSHRTATQAVGAIGLDAYCSLCPIEGEVGFGTEPGDEGIVVLLVGDDAGVGEDGVVEGASDGGTKIVVGPEDGILLGGKGGA